MPFRFIGGPSRSEITNVLVGLSLWDDIFYTTVQFEHLNGFFTALAGIGVVIINNGVLQCDSGAVAGGLAEARLSMGGYAEPLAASILNWERDRKWRADVLFNDDSDQIIYMGTGDPRLNFRFLGFKIVNNNIYGCVVSALGETLTGILYTLAGPNEVHVLEFRYNFSGSLITFYIDNIAVGTLIAGFPTGTTSAANIVFLSITNPAGGAKVVYTDFWEFYQAR